MPAEGTLQLSHGHLREYACIRLDLLKFGRLEGLDVKSRIFG